MYIWIEIERASERKPGETDSQFIYKTRKKALGPFKHAIWDLPPEVLDPIMDAVEVQADLFLIPLKTTNTGTMVRKYVKAPQEDLAWIAPASYGGASERFEGAD